MLRSTYGSKGLPERGKKMEILDSSEHSNMEWMEHSYTIFRVTPKNVWHLMFGGETHCKQNFKDDWKSEATKIQGYEIKSRFARSGYCKSCARLWNY